MEEGSEKCDIDESFRFVKAALARDDEDQSHCF